MDLEHLTRRTWAEIDLAALEHNYRTLRAMLPQECKLLCPVKANAYGHGAVPVAKRLEQLGADYLAVACLDEALELRSAGVELPVLILGYTDPKWTEELVENSIAQTVFALDDARDYSEKAAALGKRLTVHLKADTGMTRLGLLCDEPDLEETAEIFTAISALPGLDVEGIFTHFANADGSEEYTMLQLTRFLELLDRLGERGVKIPIRHCAASAAVLYYPCTHLDMVRPGIALYGHYPDPSLEELDDGTLLPLMTLKTRVISVKNVPAGTAVSYGCTHTLNRPTRLAALAIGYGDGLPRLCSDRLKVWVRGAYAPVVGRICMDQCMVDVTDIESVAVGDEVEVYGSHVPVEHAAALANTIQYELLCNVSGRVPRVYLN